MHPLLIIFPSVIVMLIVIGVAINGIVGKVLAHRRWQEEQSRGGPQKAAEVSQLSERTDLIEDRLRVLERLATDRGTLLSDEIEALRETPAISATRKDKEPG